MAELVITPNYLLPANQEGAFLSSALSISPKPVFQKAPRDYFAKNALPKKPQAQPANLDLDRFQKFKKYLLTFKEYYSPKDLARFEKGIREHEVEFLWLDTRRFPCSIIITQAFARASNPKERQAFDMIARILIETLKQERKSYQDAQNKIANEKFKVICARFAV